MKKTVTFEEFMKERHMDECPEVLDDDLPDSFDDWIGALDVEEWLGYGQAYGKRCLADTKDGETA